MHLFGDTTETVRESQFKSSCSTTPRICLPLVIKHHDAVTGNGGEKNTLWRAWPRHFGLCRSRFTLKLTSCLPAPYRGAGSEVKGDGGGVGWILGKPSSHETIAGFLRGGYLRPPLHKHTPLTGLRAAFLQDARDGAESGGGSVVKPCESERTDTHTRARAEAAPYQAPAASLIHYRHRNADIQVRKTKRFLRAGVLKSFELLHSIVSKFPT